jgi:hypothetical protein
MNAVTTVANGGALVSFIERAAVDPNFDVGKFEALLRMQREVEQDQARKAFNAAMARAQGEMDPVRKGATNPHTRSKYARFEDIDMMLKPIYTRHGFSVRFRTEDAATPGWVKVVCVVAHEAGHIETFPLQAPLDSGGTAGKTNKTDVQAIGSTTSYLKRYLLTLAWNVSLAGDDDDGEGSRRQAAPARTWADDAPKRPYPARRMDPVQSMDETLRGDIIPDFDAPPVVDKVQQGVEALEARVRAVTTEDELHAITGDSKTERQLEYLAKHRPELHLLITGAIGERYRELVAARQEAEAEAAAATEAAA